MPKRVRWYLAKKPSLVSPALEVFLRALFGWQCRRGRQLGVEGEAGAVSFIQRFGSALQANLHFHVLVPDGRFGAEGQWLPLPPPSGEEVAQLVELVAARITRLLVRRGVLEDESGPEDALERLTLESLQRRLPLPLEPPAPPRPHARCASVAGYSLHAATQVHQNDREGLMRLVRYGSRGARASTGRNCSSALSEWTCSPATCAAAGASCSRQLPSPFRRAECSSTSGYPACRCPWRQQEGLPSRHCGSSCRP